jgi:hypothetical protein
VIHKTFSHDLETPIQKTAHQAKAICGRSNGRIPLTNNKQLTAAAQAILSFFWHSCRRSIQTTGRNNIY